MQYYQREKKNPVPQADLEISPVLSLLYVFLEFFKAAAWG